ncbi:hypothetical protein [Paenibacillus cisolokensis]|nr:hypothetical protein [Paenibacillus cisolokensis]
MELKAYFKMIWNRKWMIAVIVTLTCIAVGVKSYFLPYRCIRLRPG